MMLCYEIVGIQGLQIFSYVLSFLLFHLSVLLRQKQLVLRENHSKKAY